MTRTNTPLPLPFADLTVLDISQGIAGPYCAHLLWQQGARVIKVEPPAGDWGRGVGAVRGQFNALTVAYNAGKESVCVDAARADGQRVLRALAARADVIVQNFRPGVAERLGIGPARMMAERPGLVYVSISGYGEHGPMSGAPATDSVLQADSGLMHANRDAQGEPRRIGMLVVDAATGLYGAQAACAALYRQARTGVGTHVELNLFESCVALQIYNLMEQSIAPGHTAKAASAPNGVYPTADGLITIVTLNNAQFEKLTKALGRPEWLTDARFADAARRLENAAAINAAVAADIGRHPTAHWLDVLTRQDVLHAPVRDYAGLVAHPQAAHLGTFQALEQPGLGTLPYPGAPAHALRRPVTAAPRIGEHTLAVLTESGFDAGALDAWRADGTIVQDATARD